MVQMYEMQRTPEMESNAVKASQDFVAYLRDFVAERRRRPSEDLISQLIAAEAEGEKLTEDELIANCILLLNAGHEATVNVIGNGLLALLKSPDPMNQWRANTDPAFDKLAVEELMRYDTPLHQFNRWVLNSTGHSSRLGKKSPCS
jgi:cytochrome P450